MAVLTAWCEHHEIPYQGVPVGTIKRSTTGRGNASKDDMIAAATALLGSRAPEDDNEADAICLLQWALEETEGVR